MSHTLAVHAKQNICRYIEFFLEKICRIGAFSLHLQRKCIKDTTMKKLLITCMAVFTAFVAFAQSEATINDLKQQKKVLELTAKLKQLQLNYEKEKASFESLAKEVAAANAAANIASTNFSTSDASGTVKDAKAMMKQLKETKKLNKKLAKSQKKLDCLQKKISKTQDNIDKMDKTVEIDDK